MPLRYIYDSTFIFGYMEYLQGLDKCRLDAGLSVGGWITVGGVVATHFYTCTAI